MGNLQTFGGPLSDNYINFKFYLAIKIVKRVRQFGMLTVFPAFAGHVPQNLARVYPSAKITQLSTWSHFNCTYSCTTFLEPEDALFTQIGSALINQYIKFFGTDHIYNSDLFNEMTPKT
ncbi:alpha-N-acetylglucosaminidase-like protein, partial [Leptotrombidium deliense]